MSELGKETVDRLRKFSECEHNWVDDYMGDPDVPGGQKFFGYCTKCGASSDSPGKNVSEAPTLDTEP